MKKMLSKLIVITLCLGILSGCQSNHNETSSVDKTEKTNVTGEIDEEDKETDSRSKEETEKIENDDENGIIGKVTPLNPNPFCELYYSGIGIILENGTVYEWSNGSYLPVNTYTKKVKYAGGFGGENLYINTDGTAEISGDAGSYTNTDGTEEIHSYPANEFADIEKISKDYSDTLVALKNDKILWICEEASFVRNGGEIDTEKTIFSKIDGLENIVDFSVNGGKIYVLKSDGTIWKNDTTNENQYEYFDQIESLENIIAIDSSTSYGHVLALQSDGTVWAGGNNHNFELGHKNVETSQVPLKVEGINDVIAISAGNEYSIALKDDGTVWKWGDDGENPESEDNYIPKKIEGLENIISVYAYASSGLALDQDGYVWSWGNNNFGQMGDGTQGDYYSTPVQVKNQDGTGFLNYYE